MSDRSAPRAVGDVVYPAYSPLRLGRVVGIERDAPQAYDQRLHVRWRDASTTTVRGDDVLRLTDLIADHEAKLAGHRARLAELETLIPVPLTPNDRSTP